jgi:hypothetical protein
MPLPQNPASAISRVNFSRMKTIAWLEKLTVGGILFLILREGIAPHEVYFDEDKATPRALKFAALLAKLLSVRFYPANLSKNDKDEKGLSLEYCRSDYHCAIGDKFCQSQLNGEPEWLRNISKCFISLQLVDRITFVTLVLQRIKGMECSEHVIYLSGHYLNYLLEDFFKPKIMLKSVPSITPFLRLVVTPFALMMRTCIHQLFQDVIKGSIRENPKNPAVWIEMSSKSGVWDQLKEFIAIHSAGRPYDIVYYMDRTDTYAVPETIKELDDQRFDWIDTHDMLHAQLFISDYINLMESFIILLNKRLFWVALFIFQFEVMRTLYLSLYKRFNVLLLFQHQETSWLQEAQKQAIEENGGIMAGLHWSNYWNTNYPYHLTPQHVMLVWGRAHREYLKSKGTGSYIIPCGLWLAESGAKIEDIKPVNQGNFTLAIFDDSFGYLLGLRAENISKFYLEILSVLQDHPSFSGIIKSKGYYLTDLCQIPSGEKIVAIIKSLEKQGRLRILDWKSFSPVDAAKAADLSVCFGLNSAGIVAGLLGLRAIHWDCIGWLKYPVYKDKSQKVFFANLSEVRQAILQVAEGDKAIGCFDKWRKNINHFDDCSGRERILRFINYYMDEPEGGTIGLDSAVKKYISEEKGAAEFYKSNKGWWQD